MNQQDSVPAATPAPSLVRAGTSKSEKEILPVDLIAATNDYPIILVHGLNGWGRDEMAGIKYWGGLYGDYQEELRQKGFKVYTATVGPFCSNWDRACELYAQIKGGTVDYGAKHSEKHGHNRTGRTVKTGLFPQWGDKVNGKIQKVHLVGHSMGGQTIRMLTQLLNHGTKGAETEEDPSSHPLFAGGHDWVHSVTTISTPNQGTTFADSCGGIMDTLEDIIAGVFGFAGLAGLHSTILYDAKLDHWGIAPRGNDESLRAYIKRVMNSKMFEAGFKDIAAYSLSTEGAAGENKWVKTLPNVFYYSYVTTDTFNTTNFSGEAIAMPHPFSMAVVLQPSGQIIGSRFTVEDAHFTEDWQPNDGLVNVPSQINDGKGAVHKISTNPQRGAWIHMGTFDYTDHMAIIGFKLCCDVIDMYSKHATVLNDLPDHETLISFPLQGVPSHETELVTAVKDTTAAIVQEQEIQTVMMCEKTKSDIRNKEARELFLKSVNRTE